MKALRDDIKAILECIARIPTPSILCFTAVTMVIILVTGANRGIGFGIVQAIAGRVPNSTILVGCRTHESGEEAVRKWRDIGVQEALVVLPFDIEDDASIIAAATIAEEKYGKLDGELPPTFSLQIRVVNDNSSDQ